MYFQTTVRFVSALVGSLAAFFLATHFFHAIGYMTDQEVQRVTWMYNQLLSPITTLDWMTQKTALIACGVVALQALLVHGLFKKWAYKPVKEIDPLEKQIKIAATRDASGSDLPSHTIAVYNGLDDEEAEPVDASVREHQRLMKLLGHGV